LLDEKLFQEELIRFRRPHAEKGAGETPGEGWYLEAAIA
jgi:hypothetical protein